MSDASVKIDEYIAGKPEWAQVVLNKVRAIAHANDPALSEEWKWSSPVYKHKKNVFGFAAFKSHCSVHFFEGALIDDKYGLLVEGKGAAMRSFKIPMGEDIDEKILAEYMLQATLNDTKGLKVDHASKRKPLEIPDYFTEALEQNPEAKKTFDGFSYSHQREYVEYVTQAKREETRLKRLAKSIEMMTEGKGLNDKYR